VESIRRILLTGVLGVIAHGTAIQVVVGMVMMVFIVFNIPQYNFSPNVLTDVKLMFFMLVLEHCMHIFVMEWNYIDLFAVFPSEIRTVW
jgi:hypothetical protein